MSAFSLLPGVAVSLSLSLGALSYSNIGAGYSGGDVQQSLARTVSEVTAAYAASGTATITSASQLFPANRLMPGSVRTSWSITSVDATHATLCMSRTATSLADWAATVRGYALARMSVGAATGCTAGTQYTVPTSFPAILYAYKSLTRAAPSQPQKFKISGLSGTGVAVVYGPHKTWGPPRVLTVTPATALTGTYSISTATATGGFGVQTTCNAVPGNMPCNVYLYYAAPNNNPNLVNSGTATLTLSTGDTLFIPLSGNLAW